MEIGKVIEEKRTKLGLSQKEFGSLIGVSDRTISKFENCIGVPDIFLALKICEVLNISIYELLGEKTKKTVKRAIKNNDDKVNKKLNWTKLWGEKYPVLVQYQNEVDINKYSDALKKLLDDLKNTYNYNELDAMLVLKDILAHVYFKRQKNR